VPGVEGLGDERGGFAVGECHRSMIDGGCPFAIENLATDAIPNCEQSHRLTGAKLLGFLLQSNLTLVGWMRARDEHHQARHPPDRPAFAYFNAGAVRRAVSN
jgi:hypothetical protein